MPVRDNRKNTGSRRPRVLTGLALFVVIGVAVVVVTSSGSPSKLAERGGKTGSGAGVATVKRRDLVLTDTEPGTLSYSDPQTVYDRLSGTITWLPRVGQQINPGGTLFKVDGKPVILMNGSTPAYRDLTPADGDGADILELNRNLVALGFDAGGIRVDDTWQAATTLGVDLLQESLRETPTGNLSLGQVVFLPADQLVSTVEGTLGNGNGSSSNASTTADPPAPEFVSLTVTPGRRTRGAGSKHAKRRKRSHTSRPAHHKPTLAALVALLKAEVEELRSQHSPPSSGQGGRAPSSGSPSGGTNPDAPPRNGNGNGGNGSGNGNGSGGGASPQVVLQTTSTHLVVTVDLSATSQSEATVGQHVTVVMPSGDSVAGRITAVSPVAQNASNSGDNSSGNGGGGGSGGGGGGQGNGNGGGVSSTIPVTIALSGRTAGAGMDQAAVSVNFVQQRADHVLSVPVTALLATSGAHYAVQEAAAPHRLIQVRTGLFAAGYVQISGPGIHPDVRVTDSLG
jgi:hypothetical protein